MNKIKAILLIIIGMLIFPIAATTSHAGMFDRFKDIYEAPDRLQELQDQYESTKEMMEGQLETQREQLELSRQQAMDLLAQQEELMRSNERYQQQNEALLADNEALLAQMAQSEANRQAFYRKVGLTIGILLSMAAAYAVSVRIWRFAVWRKQGREGHDGHGVMLP